MAVVIVGLDSFASFHMFYVFHCVVGLWQLSKSRREDDGSPDIGDGPKLENHTNSVYLYVYTIQQ